MEMPDASSVARAIELALAPGLLFVGIGGILAVMTGRLVRIVDRGRALTEGEVPGSREAAPSRATQSELHSLERRRDLASAAITWSTASALLLCMVIAALFVQVLLHIELSWLVGVLFAGSTATLVIGLAYYLAEVQIATKTVRIAIAKYRQ